MSDTPNSEKRAGVGSYVAAGLVLVLLLGLGTWQMQRRAWKEALLRTISERQALAPVTAFDPVALGCDAARGLLDPCEFRPIRLTGRIADAREVHIFISIPRQPNGLQGVGYWVMRPVTQSVTEGSPPLSRPDVWVNTGFLPRDQKSKAGVTGDIELVGVIRQRELRQRFSGANDLKNNIYYVRDPSEFPPCAAPSCRPAFPSHYIDMTGPLPKEAASVPYPMAGKLAIPNRHLEYALTWYGLAATWLVIAAIALRRRASIG